MNYARVLTPLLIVLSGMCGNVQAAPVPSFEVAQAQLRAINHRFVNVFVRPDPEFMQTLTYDDFVRTRADGVWQDRAEFLTNLPSAGAFDGASTDDVRVRLFGSVAVVHALFEGVKGEQVTKVRYTDVFVWDGDRWRLVSGQNTIIKPEVSVPQNLGTAPTHAPWQGKDPSGDDLSVLRQLNEHYVRAFRESDVAWYDAHLADDYVAVYGNGAFHDRASALSDFAKPTFREHLKSFPVDRVRIRRFDDVALIHAENAFEFKDGRRAISRYTDIWVKQNGQWRCVAAHITAHQPPT